MPGAAARPSHQPPAASVVALAFTAALLTGCDSSSGPSDTVSELGFELSTSEWEPDRNLLVVGESGWVQVKATARPVMAGQCSDVLECPVSVDVEIRSTNPAVVAPVQQRVRTPARVAIVAHAPGTAVVSAAVAGLSHGRRVDVVAAPLPVDSIRIWAWWLQEGTTAGAYDSAGQLVQLTLPVMGYAGIETIIWRNQVEVYMPWTATSSDSAVAWASLHCRAPALDPNCQVASFGGWVTGLAAGEATVTITARNLQRSFAVTVK